MLFMPYSEGHGWPITDPLHKPPVGEWVLVLTVRSGNRWIRARLDEDGLWEDENGQKLDNIKWWDELPGGLSVHS